MQIFCGISEFSWVMLFLSHFSCNCYVHRFTSSISLKLEGVSAKKINLGLRKCLKMFEPKISLRGAFHAVFFHA